MHISILFIIFLDFFLMWAIFSVLIEFFTVLLPFYILVFCPRGMWDPSSLPEMGIEATPAALEGQVLNTRLPEKFPLSDSFHIQAIMEY